MKKTGGKHTKPWNLNLPTFSGIIEEYFVTDKSAACFSSGLVEVLDSKLESITEELDELFSLSKSSSFKFKVTSPLLMSTFLTTIPASLWPKRIRRKNLS